MHDSEIEMALTSNSEPAIIAVQQGDTVTAVEATEPGSTPVAPENLREVPSSSEETQTEKPVEKRRFKKNADGIMVQAPHPITKEVI